MTEIPNVSSSVEFITPEQAALWVKHNNIENNRNLRERQVARFIRDMDAGKWQIAQPLIFDNKGTLIDGQHRLKALSKCKNGVMFLVVRGVDTEAVRVIDTGSPRNAENIAKLTGSNIKNIHFACLRAMYAAPGADKKSVFSPQQAIEKIESLGDCIFFSCRGANGSVEKDNLTASAPIVKNAKICAVVARAYFYEDHQRLEEFLTCVRTGYITKEEDFAAQSLRNHYLHGERKRGFQRSNRGWSEAIELFLCAQTALVHFLNRKPLKRLTLPKEPKCIWHVEEIDGPKGK